ncbi:hypothetical protein Tcan_12765 [Toxocara canis]|uniref:Uncharacterized protein n=1 Tax=Toxocara canis TaxID=6265 RepID=A0A0B2VKJ6_TOXCA|nr:hypothetical protein Tcan_12765 [Toxocara canis]
MEVLIIAKDKLRRSPQFQHITDRLASELLLSRRTLMKNPIHFNERKFQGVSCILNILQSDIIHAKQHLAELVRVKFFFLHIVICVSQVCTASVIEAVLQSFQLRQPSLKELKPVMLIVPRVFVSFIL